MGRPPGSKNKTKKAIVLGVGQLADYHSKVFIASYSIEKAERLAQLILEKIRAQKKIIGDKL